MAKIKTESMWRCDICGASELAAESMKPSGWNRYTITSDSIKNSPLEFDACRTCGPSTHDRMPWKAKIQKVTSKLFKKTPSPVDSALPSGAKLLPIK